MIVQQPAPATHADAIKAIADQYGFCHVPGVFSADEMAAIEQSMAHESANFPDGFPDLYSVPSLSWLLHDPRIQDIARRLLGDELVYYRLTNIAYEAAPGPLTDKPFDEFHCDARGTPDDLNNSDPMPPESVYPAYRFAIYCRDYSQHSGGLKVAVGSHLIRFSSMRKYAVGTYLSQLPKVEVKSGALRFTSVETPFPLHNVPSRPGDLVIFNLRTFHAAGALRFRDRPELALLPPVEASVRSSPPAEPFLMPKSPGSRNAIFFDFTRPSPEVDLYIKWIAWRAANAVHLVPIGTNGASGFRIRNDIILVNRASYLLRECEKLGLNLRTTQPSWPLPAPLDGVAEEFLSLCEKHEEFSPHYALLVPAEYAKAAAQGPASALSYAVNSIAAMLEKAEFDRSKAKA